MGVVLLRWPAEHPRRRELHAIGAPRLLLVEGDTPAPLPIDEYEDWVRVPAPESDLYVRVEALERRAELRPEEFPRLDENGVLSHDGRWIPLPGVEARLLRLMIERRGTVVSRDALTDAAWPAGQRNRNALDVRILRLRRRIADTRLTITTVRSRGYLLAV